jgi:hypothetical protein
MAGRNTNIYFPEQLYNRLRQLVGSRISRFVSEAVAEKLAKTEQKSKVEFQQKLIAGYKRVAKNRKIQQELAAWDETISDMWKKENK